MEVGDLYEHHSGKIYKIVALGKDADTLEEIVTYEAPDGAIWHHKRDNFENAKTSDGRPRFWPREGVVPARASRINLEENGVYLYTVGGMVYLNAEGDLFMHGKQLILSEEVQRAVMVIFSVIKGRALV